MIKTQNIIAQIDKNVKSKKWECLVDNCHEFAINSHLVQQNGILNNISSKGHLVELKLTDTNKWGNKSPLLEFCSVGIKQALSHKVFCNKHDSSLFKEIENKESNFESYNAFLLFCYRAACAEIAKKRLEIEKDRRIINANTLDGKINKKALSLRLNSFEEGVYYLKILKEELEAELEGNSDKFTFFAYRYPCSGVYASAIFSAANTGMLANLHDELRNIYIHILPLVDYTLILIGFNNNYTSDLIKSYCKSWNNLNLEELQIKLSNLFTYNIENWGMAPDLFYQLKPEIKDKFISLASQNSLSYGLDLAHRFNLFSIK